jgi:hypothetical protein
MSQSRRERRNLERKLGLRKKSTAFFSPDESEMREKRKKAGVEIHRQNLENQRNKNYGVYDNIGNTEVLEEVISETTINLGNLGILTTEGPKGSE